MKKSYLLNVLMLCCALFVCTSTWAKAENDQTPATTEGTAQTHDGDLTHYYRNFPVTSKPVTTGVTKTATTDHLSN